MLASDVMDKQFRDAGMVALIFEQQNQQSRPFPVQERVQGPGLPVDQLELDHL
jgi:hypothetical protein